MSSFMISTHSTFLNILLLVGQIIFQIFKLSRSIVVGLTRNPMPSREILGLISLVNLKNQISLAALVKFLIL